MVLVVASYKGGVAKTTTALHAAGVLVLERPMLLIYRHWSRGAVQWYCRIEADEGNQP